MKIEQHPTCHDCGVSIGEYHQRGCDVEACPYCGHQLLSCDCEYRIHGRYPPLDDRMPWTGLWPGVGECHEFAWFARPDSRGWTRCTSDHPEAAPDLNRLIAEAMWDREGRRWIKPGSARWIELFDPSVYNK